MCYNNDKHINGRFDIMFLLFLLATLDFVNGDFFRGLIEKHCDKMKSYAFGKVHNEQDAEEITQDIFLKVYRYIDKFKGLEETDTRRLLISYAKSSIADFYRKNKKSVKTIDGYYYDNGNEVDIPDNSMSPETIVISEDTCRKVASCIESLPEAQRNVMILKYDFSHSDGEIAKILGISEQAVSSRANRARRSLRKMMGGKI